MDHFGALQVLVVDDSQQMRFLVRSVLRAAGLTRVAEAQSAQDAINFLNRFSVDLIILDWHMRPMDGLELTRQIRTGGVAPNPEAPIVMLTAHTERSRVAAARDAGVNGLVRKPISTQMLLDRCAAALNDTRPFIRAPGFYGPDRRRGAAYDYLGPFRRFSDGVQSQIELD